MTNLPSNLATEVAGHHETCPFVECPQRGQQADLSPRQTALLTLADISMTAAAALFSRATWGPNRELREAL